MSDHVRKFDWEFEKPQQRPTLPTTEENIAPTEVITNPVQVIDPPTETEPVGHTGTQQEPVLPVAEEYTIPVEVAIGPDNTIEPPVQVLVGLDHYFSKHRNPTQ